MLQARVAASPALPAYRESVGKDLPWKQLSWGEVGAAVMQYRCALQRSGIVHADRVGIWLPNSIYAMCMDQAALQIGAIAVPVHSTDNPASIAYIFDNAEISLLVLSSLSQWERVRGTEYAMASLRMWWSLICQKMYLPSRANPACSAWRSGCRKAKRWQMHLPPPCRNEKMWRPSSTPRAPRASPRA